MSVDAASGHVMTFPPGEFVNFRVVAFETGSPLAGAEVLVSGGKTDLTDRCGRIWQTLPAGRYRVSVKSRGYTPRSLEFEVLDQAVDLEIVLTKQP